MKKPLMGVIAGGVLLIGGMTVVGTVLSAPFCIDNEAKNISERIEFCPVSGKQRALFKSQEIGKINLVSTYTDSRGQTIEITANPVAINVAGQNGVELFARAWRKGKRVGFGKDGSVEIERFRIFNPPVKVPAGTYHVEYDPIIKKDVLVQNYIENPAEAIRQDLAHTISLVGKENTKITIGKVGNTTDTYYPDADPESTSVDGMAYRSTTPENWNTLRTSAGNGSSDNSDTSFNQYAFYGATDIVSNYTFIIRGFFLFDTSAIPDTDTVDSATLSLFGTALTDALGATPALAIVGSTPASNTAIVNADYTQVGSTRYASDIPYASLSASAYNDMALNASGISAVSKTGITKFATLSDNDVDNSAPSFVSDKDFVFKVHKAEAAGTSNDPKLVVVHSAASASIAPDDGLILFE